MMTRESDKKREQVMFFSMDDMVPKDHLLRLIEQSIDFSFIYELVEDRYCPDNGRPSIDPVMLIKIQLIQCLYGIRSMRQTIKDIEVNVAYRWFLGLSLLDEVPHFTTLGKNYTRRFKGTDLYEKIFERVLCECMNCGFVDMSTVFIDSTHIKAAATGGCKTTLAGNAATAILRAAGASGIDAEGLVSNSVEAIATGASSITCDAQKKLSATYSGAAKIGYKGSPSIETRSNRGIYRIGK